MTNQEKVWRSSRSRERWKRSLGTFNFTRPVGQFQCPAFDGDRPGRAQPTP